MSWDDMVPVAHVARAARASEQAGGAARRRVRSSGGVSLAARDTGAGEARDAWDAPESAWRSRRGGQAAAPGARRGTTARTAGCSDTDAEMLAEAICLVCRLCLLP